MKHGGIKTILLFSNQAILMDTRAAGDARWTEGGHAERLDLGSARVCTGSVCTLITT